MGFVCAGTWKHQYEAATQLCWSGDNSWEGEPGMHSACHINNDVRKDTNMQQIKNILQLRLIILCSLHTGTICISLCGVALLPLLQIVQHYSSYNSYYYY